MSTDTTTFPELSVTAKGNSGISIRAKLTKKFDCIEFTLRNDVPQDVLISPWLQFEPVELAEERLKLAYEIARRASIHETLVKQIQSLQEINESLLDTIDRKERRFNAAIEMWRAERVKLGLQKDFGDIKEWPPEMMSEYC